MPEQTRATRERILRTALDLFTAQGYDATSLRQIAERLGFTKAALYYHFPAKDLMIIELTRPWLDALSLLVTRYDDAGASHEDRLRLLADYVDVLTAHHAVLRLLSQDAGTQNHPDVGRRLRTLIGALQSALAGPEADDGERVRVACALGAVHAVAMIDAEGLPAARPIVLAAAAAAMQVDVPSRE